MFFYNYPLITLFLCFIDLEIKNLTQKYHSDFTICNYNYFKFDIKYCINKGVMYGMHNNIPPKKLIGISLFSMLILIFYYYYRILDILPLIIGSMFNIYDRFICGYVRDYLYMEILGFKTNIFNFPDFCILLNMLLLFF
jgi:lipoprotein signal peptidase